MSTRDYDLPTPEEQLERNVYDEWLEKDLNFGVQQQWPRIEQRREERLAAHREAYEETGRVGMLRERRYGRSRLGREEFEQLTPGDPERVAREYMPSAQYTSAAAEKAHYDAAEAATRTLERYGPTLSPQQRERLEAIAETGAVEEGGGVLYNLGNILDALGRTARLAFTDATGADDEASPLASTFGLFGLGMAAFRDDEKGVREEITLKDYGAVFRHDYEELQERHSDEWLKDFGFLDDEGGMAEGPTGQHVLSRLGLFDFGEADEDEGFWEKFGQTTAGFAFDVIYDPLTYVSFGTAGLGRKAAMAAYTSGIVGTSARGARAGFKGAVTHLLEGGKADDLVGYARIAANQLEERVAKEIDDVTREILETQAKHFEDARHLVRGRHVAGQVDDRLEETARLAARQRILSQEQRAVDLVEGLKLTEVDDLVKEIGDLPEFVKLDTVFGREVSEVTKLVAEKKFRTLGKNHSELVRWMDGNGMKWATGGVGITLPFMRRSMPILKLNKTRLDGPMQKFYTNMLDRFPGGQSLRRWNEQFSNTRKLLNRAKAWSPDDPNARAVSNYFVEDQLIPGALRKGPVGEKVAMLADDVKTLNGTMKKIAGKSAEKVSYQDVGKAVLRIASSPDNMIDNILAQVPADIADDVMTQATALRQTLDSIHGAAEAVGWNLGTLDKYVPLIANDGFNKLIREMGERGTAVTMAGVTDGETRLGLEVLGEMVEKYRGHVSAATAIGDSKHAKARIVTTAFEQMDTSAALLDQKQLINVVEGAEHVAYDHETLNRAMEKALQVLQDRNVLNRSQVRSALRDGAYKTDLGEVMANYSEAMFKAINIRQRQQIYKSAGLMVPRGERVSVTRTLKHVNDAINSDRHPIMRFLDDLAETVDAEGAQAVANRVSKKVAVQVDGGWSIEVPAGITETEPFKVIVRELKKVYKQTNTHIARQSAETKLAIDNMILNGVPAEVARQVGLVESHGQYAALREGLLKLADEQATEMMVLAMEQAARNTHKIDAKATAAVMRKAAREADKIRAGVRETLEQMDDRMASKLKIPTGQQIVPAMEDVTDAMAPGGRQSFTSWLADIGDQELSQYLEGGWKDLRDLTPEALTAVREGANPAVAYRAAEDLVDRLNLVTVDNLVEFSGLESAAVTLDVLYRRALDAGIAPEQLSRIADDDLLLAVDVLREADSYLMDVRSGMLDELFEPEQTLDDLVAQAGDVTDEAAQRAREIKRTETVTAAKAEVAEARRFLRETALETLSTRRDTNLGAVVELLKDTITDVQEDALFGDAFNEAWGTAMWMVSNRSKSEAAQDIALNIDWAKAERASLRAKAKDAAHPRGYHEKLAESAKRITGEGTIPQKELYKNNSKLVARTAASDARTLWHEAVDHAVEMRGFGSLSGYEPSHLQRAIVALRAGDMEALRTYVPEIDLLLSIAMPTTDVVAEITPAGRLALRFPKEENVFTTLDDVLPTMKDIVGEGADEMSSNEIFAVIHDVWRDNPEVISQFDETLASFMQGVDSTGGFDTFGENFEYLARFSDDLLATSQQLTKEARSISAKAGHASRAKAKIDEGLAGVEEVMGAVEQSMKGNAKSTKALNGLWEKNAGRIIEGMPPDVVNRARAAVEYAIGANELKLPIGTLNRQLQVQSNVWRPLSDSVEAAMTLADDLAAEATTTGNQSLGAAAAQLRDFIGTLKRLNDFGRTSTDPSAALLDAVEAAPFIQTLGELQDKAAALSDLPTNLKALAPDLFANSADTPSKFKNIDRWVEHIVNKANEWEPVQVGFAEYQNYKNVTASGIVGEMFTDQIVDKQIAMVLENLAGGLHASNNPLLWKETGKAIRELSTYWRSAVTVGRFLTFVPRNVIGGIFNGLLAGANSKHYSYGARKILPKLEVIRKGGATWQDFIDEALEAGDHRLAITLDALHESQTLDVSFVDSQLEHLITPGSTRQRLNPFSKRNILFEKGGTIMEQSEWFLRVGVFVANFDPPRRSCHDEDG